MRTVSVIQPGAGVIAVTVWARHPCASASHSRVQSASVCPAIISTVRTSIDGYTRIFRSRGIRGVPSNVGATPFSAQTAAHPCR